MNKKSLRIGTTSYIIPDDILPNVRYLGPHVDDIELVLFESESISNLPDEQTIAELARLAELHDLTYTVHFPLDIYPGSKEREERDRFVSTLNRIIELTEPLKPFGYVLHLTPDSYGPVPSEDTEAWLEHVDTSLDRFFEHATLDSRMLCVETLSYPFSLVQPLVEKYNLSITLDIGHIWLMGYDMQANLDALLERCRISHLHGVEDKKDHLGLEKGNQEQIGIFLHALRRQCEKDAIKRVLTLEVFSEEEFSSSLAVVEQIMV